jgi:hypothetical protein
MVAKAVYLAFIIGNLVPTTVFRFQAASFSLSAFRYVPPCSAPNFGLEWIAVRVRIGPAKGDKSVLPHLAQSQDQRKTARTLEPCAQLEFKSTVFTGGRLRNSSQPDHLMLSLRTKVARQSHG